MTGWRAVGGEELVGGASRGKLCFVGIDLSKARVTERSRRRGGRDEDGDECVYCLHSLRVRVLNDDE